MFTEHDSLSQTCVRTQSDVLDARRRQGRTEVRTKFSIVSSGTSLRAYSRLSFVMMREVASPRRPLTLTGTLSSISRSS